MKNYRICYDNLFLVDSNCDLEYNGEKIDDLDIFFEYRIFNRYGEELLFNCDDNAVMREQYWYDKPLNQYFKCCYDRNSDTGYTITQVIKKDDDFTIKPFVNSCYIRTKNNINPQRIDYETFCSLLKENPDCFDCSNNHPTQTVAWGGVNI